MANDVLKTQRRTAQIDATLVYYDGPQVLTLKGKRESVWIGVAVDYKNYGYPIFCTQISEQDFDRYMRGHVDLRYLFLYSKVRDYRITDLMKSSTKGLYLNPMPDPPQSWFPEEGFFSRSHTEEVIRTDQEATTQRVLDVAIDGQWDIPDFAAFSERMSECYSFLYSIDALSSPGTTARRRKKFKDTFEKYPWRGGASPLNFYNDLYNQLPANDRLGVKQIKYASPGRIEIRGSAVIFDELTSILNILAESYPLACECYQRLHQYLAGQKLLSSSSETIRGTDYQQTTIKRYLDELAPAIGFNQTEQVLAYSDGNWVLCAKIVLSFFRRLNKLFQFYAEGRASLDMPE